MTEMKNSQTQLIWAGKRISEFEHRLTEVIQSQEQKAERKRKTISIRDGGMPSHRTAYM